MDLVICEAPLNNSFQKEKLELVNKGSLGRRRKPSRANLKLLLSPTSHISSSTSRNSSLNTTLTCKTRSEPSITPVYVEQKIIVKSNKERNVPHQRKIGLKIESSLPRTSPETNQYLNEAQQFTIEAKLKRRKSDTGRSAVLIQTWERRTRCDSFSSRPKPKIVTRTNRFQNKENMGGSTAFPNSHPACPNHNGTIDSSQSSKDGGFVANVRDHFSNGTMPSSNVINGYGHEKIAKMHINSPQYSEDEPEWISLSRKLRAKFVEGHIEQDSTDSYSYEESEGVKTAQVHTQQIKTVPQTEYNPVEKPKKVEKKIKVIVDTNGTITTNGEPPWVQLSRKLCTKFIEEHIEYPIISNDLPVRDVSAVLDGKGDVRIIEKIGKPKDRKSKTRKESEPEWVSLSKKLRAKFIESHIDDPDTISLDNQLNASDPEETSSDSLSDSLSETTSSQKVLNECKQYESQCFVQNNVNYLNGDRGQTGTKNISNELSFPEKECCWEYQEMEFDQESNSGTFLESELAENHVVDISKINSQLDKDKNRIDSFKKDKNSQVYSHGLSFADAVNHEPFHNAECYNNDVRFPVHFDNSSKTQKENTDFDKKFITVQFIAHLDKNIHTHDEHQNSTSNSSPLSSSPINNNSDFFNISAWEEAHFKSEDAHSERNISPNQTSPPRKVKSKSLDNLCDADENIFDDSSKLMTNRSEIKKSEESLVKSSLLRKSEFTLNQTETSEFSQSSQNDFNNDFNLHDSNETLSKDLNSDQRSPTDVHEEQGKKLEKSASSKNSESTDFSKIGTKEDHKKQIKCNGVIPNSRKNFDDVKVKIKTNLNTPSSNQYILNRDSDKVCDMKPRKTIEVTKVNEYANISPIIVKNSSVEMDSNCDLRKKSAASMSILEHLVDNDSTSHLNGRLSYAIVNKKSNPIIEENNNLKNGTLNISCEENSSESRSLMKLKSTSLCDIPNSFSSKEDCRKNVSNDISHFSSGSSKVTSEVKFQHFKSEADIPLCAKLVKQNGKCSTSSISSSYRNASPCSESSHVYEDMFKETTSCPSDSETSSWTVLKNNSSYYINGRSSSMNDLDYSDSCSMSVKCDYASSCSEQSTLQSRHSSCTSSSFYVNLRDYDSHMLEPSLNRKKDHKRKNGNDKSSKVINSNPPTPESLRHLFTSPFNSNSHRGNRLMNKLPSEPDIHYYSSASAASTAFKHGFDPSPPKQKKTERSSSIKIKDIAHGIILTFRKFQNHSKNSHVSSTHYVDVSHLAESSMKSEPIKSKSKKGHKDKMSKQERKGFWGFPFENGKNDSDSGCQLSASELQTSKARRSSSDLTGFKPSVNTFGRNEISESFVVSEKKKIKNGKKISSAREKGKKGRSKSAEPKTIPTVSRKVQQLSDGTFYLVTTVSGDTALPGVYSDSPDTSSELSSHKPIKPSGESNC